MFGNIIAIESSLLLIQPNTYKWYCIAASAESDTERQQYTSGAQ